MKREVVLILNDIRSAENVGAIFRTADAVGVSKIYLVGTTPAPIDRFGRARRDIAKAALGAEKNISFESVSIVSSLIKRLKNNGFKIIAIEQSPNSKDYKRIKAPKRAAFMVGNEVNGIPQSLLSQCDSIAEIPQQGKKESLNVATALGIALFRILNI